jgi:hypothetical protein
MLDLLGGREPENRIVSGELMVRQTTARLLSGKRRAASG